jgi:acetyl esterase/lipase
VRLALALCLLAAQAAAQEVPAPLLPFVADAVVGAVPLRETGDAADEQWFGEGAQALYVRNVTRPTLRPVLPDPSIATGTAAVVVPGGGFVALDMGNEGMEVARALAAAGIAAFVVKYRTEATPRDATGFAADVTSGIGAFLAAGPGAPIPGEAAALEDLGDALALVRLRAENWGVDPDKLGVLGFSAGAITALNAVTAGESVAFAGVIYGRMAEVTPPEGAPPLFAALAADDPLFGAAPFGLADSWRRAGLPVELHYYAGGGHGFGMGPRGTTSDMWFAQFLGWLEAQDLLARE